MGIIKSINLNKFENDLEEIVGLSFKIRLWKEQYEIIMNHTKINSSSFSSGNISREIYDKNRVSLESERKKLVEKINKTIERVQKINDAIQKSIIEYRI